MTVFTQRRSRACGLEFVGGTAFETVALEEGVEFVPDDVRLLLVELKGGLAEPVASSRRAT